VVGKPSGSFDFDAQKRASPLRMTGEGKVGGSCGGRTGLVYLGIFGSLSNFVGRPVGRASRSLFSRMYF
jgi:hypothetical protein